MILPYMIRSKGNTEFGESSNAWLHDTPRLMAQQGRVRFSSINTDNVRSVSYFIMFLTVHLSPHVGRF